MANIRFTNFAHSQLAVGISAGDLSLSVTGGHGARFPSLTGGQYFYVTLEDASLNREIVKVTARATDTFTIVRAQDSTAARAWVAGDTVALRFNAAAIDDALFNTVLQTSATGSATVPAGTTAQRDGSPSAGYFRYNSSLTSFEGYTGSAWRLTAMATAATGSLVMPAGTSAERDGSPAFGYTRANSTLTRMEWYNGATWTAMGGGATGAGVDAVFNENDKLVTTSYTIGQGAMVSGVTVTIASPAVFTLTGHGFIADQPVRLTTTGALPTGLDANTEYFVISTGLTANDFRVSTSVGGSAVNTSGSQSGTHSVGKIKNALSAGVVTVATGATVTPPSGSTWTIV